MRLTRSRELLSAIEPFAVDADVRVVTGFRAVAKGAQAALLRAATAADQPAQCVTGGLGDDVDDAVDGVRAPDAGTRPADDFNALDVFERKVHSVPVHA